MASDTYGAILLTTANDVGAMLQKKMATPSGTYAPAVWAETINLLGKLPEATVSGTIATFSDGADEVPIKAWEVALSASLDGYSSVDVVQTGKNFLDDTLSNLEQGSINGSTGNNENANNRVRTINAIPFPYDKIASSYTWTIPSGCKVAIRPFDKDGNFVQLPSWALAFITQLPTDLIGQGITQMKFVLAKTDNSAITPSDIANIGFQIEVGSTATAYEPYTAPTVSTVNLGRTIYGGTADVVNGTGTDENGDDFTFEPVEISSRLGNNTMWSDEGDTEVTYRRDIDLALQSLSGSRGLMMARPPAAAETEETEPEDETTETIEETPEDMEK